MEYTTVLGYNQKVACKLGLDACDLLIFRCLQDTINKKKFQKNEINGKAYYWLNYDYVVEELPILKITKTTLIKKYKKFVKLNILDFLFIEKKGTSTYFRFNDEISLTV